MAPGDNQPPQARGIPAAPVGPTSAKLPRRAGRWTSSLRPRLRTQPLRRATAFSSRARFPGNAFLAAPRAARNGLAEHLPAAPARSPGPGGGRVAAQRGGLKSLRAQDPPPRYPPASPELPVGPLVGPWLFPLFRRAQLRRKEPRPGSGAQVAQLTWAQIGSLQV